MNFGSQLDSKPILYTSMDDYIVPEALIRHEVLFYHRNLYIKSAIFQILMIIGLTRRKYNPFAEVLMSQQCLKFSWNNYT